MEKSNYRITPVRKKRTKITLSAALVLCALFFIVGILGGRAFSSNKQAKEATKQLLKMEQEFTIEKTRAEAEIKTYESEINRLKGELAEAKQLAEDMIKAKEKEEEEKTEQAEQSDEGSEPSAEESAAVEETSPKEEKSSGSSLTRNLLIIIFAALIIVCVLILVSMFLKKNDDEDDDEDDDDEEEYELEATDYEDFEDDFETESSEDEEE